MKYALAFVGLGVTAAAMMWGLTFSGHMMSAPDTVSWSEGLMLLLAVLAGGVWIGSIIIRKAFFVTRCACYDENVCEMHKKGLKG